MNIGETFIEYVHAFAIIKINNAISIKYTLQPQPLSNYSSVFCLQPCSSRHGTRKSEKTHVFVITVKTQTYDINVVPVTASPREVPYVQVQSHVLASNLRYALTSFASVKCFNSYTSQAEVQKRGLAINHVLITHTLYNPLTTTMEASCSIDLLTVGTIS